MSTMNVIDLSLRAGSKTLINKLSIAFHPGEVWGIFGPNGSGKTTLLHSLSGLKKPINGNIFLNTENIFQLKPKQRAKKIGLLLQEAEFAFPNTVIETALMGRFPYQKRFFHYPDEDIELAKNSLRHVDLLDLKHRDVHSLSGGEKQRLSIATVLTQDPDIFLLDEPTNHLDVEQQINLLFLLKQKAVNQHKTIIMVLHDLRLLEKFCNRLLILGYMNEPIFGDCTNSLKQLYEIKPHFDLRIED